jgi:glutamate/tyrosine decarboxylase-like PLP-dependent enzyme
MPGECDLEPHLDPDDWDDFRRASHRALDEMIDYVRDIREGPVWRVAPADVLQEFTAGLPRQPRSLTEVLAQFSASIKPYSTGNVHPLFMGWVHGAGTPVGMLAEMLAAGLNANCGGRNHIGLTVERQIASWAAELFGLPAESSGLFVTGTSTANLLALLVARNAALGQVREQGLCGARLTAYTSAQAHGCVVQAAEISGIGSRHLRQIPVDAAGRIRLDLLAAAIAEDRRAGFRPFMVAATAGTVNTGAFDDLQAVAGICRAERLWFHVDGAFGALCALAPDLKHLVAGIERADSIAFDFHKWAHVPYDAGFVLVRDPEAHRRAFANPAAYLSRAPSGLAAGEVWPCDLGMDLSRGFRALKTWFTFQVFGAERIGACIAHTCRVAKHLERLLVGSELFDVVAPVALNIVCFGLQACRDGELNRHIVVDLHERGIAAPSLTFLDGKPVIRAAIVNHRTSEADMETFYEALCGSVRRVLAAEMRRESGAAELTAAAPCA